MGNISICFGMCIINPFILIHTPFICHFFIYLVFLLLRLLKQSEKGVCKGPGYYLCDP